MVCACVLGVVCACWVLYVRVGCCMRVLGVAGACWVLYVMLRLLRIVCLLGVVCASWVCCMHVLYARVVRCVFCIPCAFFVCVVLSLHATMLRIIDVHTLCGRCCFVYHAFLLSVLSLLCCALFRFPNELPMACSRAPPVTDGIHILCIILCTTYYLGTNCLVSFIALCIMVARCPNQSPMGSVARRHRWWMGWQEGRHRWPVRCCRLRRRRRRRLNGKRSQRIAPACRYDGE